MPNYDVYINDVRMSGDGANVAFRGVTSYASVSLPRNGAVKIGLKAAGFTGAATEGYVAGSTRTFVATAGSFYTVGFQGAVTGPAGQIVQNSNPIVNPDMRRVPNPSRAQGLWYRWSETDAPIDFRAVAGDPTVTAACNATCNTRVSGGSGCPACPVTTAPDVERISTLAAKTVIPWSEIPVGTGNYSFFPVTVGNSDPLFNPRTGTVVGVRALAMKTTSVVNSNPRGYWYDFFAQGNSLLLPVLENNLEVRSTETWAEYDQTTGCTFVLNSAGARVGEARAASGSAAAAQAGVGVALVGAIGTLFNAALNM